MYKALNIPVYLMIWLLDACIVIKLCAVAALRFEMNKGQGQTAGDPVKPCLKLQLPNVIHSEVEHGPVGQSIDTK